MRTRNQSLLSVSAHAQNESIIALQERKVVSMFHMFYDDYKITSLLNQNCNRKITRRDVFKLHVRVKPGFRQCEVDDKLKERLEQAMTKRYVQETDTLDLPKFRQDHSEIEF